jgi:ABC-type cobalamin/Fe3+-siderophores transport system ATPase subunit
MIWVVIGQSGAGKTTLVKDRFIRGREIGIENKPIKHSIAGDTLLIGHYGIERRCQGTDTLGYNQLPDIIKFIAEKYEHYPEIIAEGDRINNRKFLEFIKDKDPHLIVVLCSIETSLQRLRAAGSEITETFVKTTRTKALNSEALARKLGIPTDRIITDNSKDLNCFFGGS